MTCAERITWRRTDGDRSVATDHGRLWLSWDLGFVSQTNRPRGLEYERPDSAFALLDPILFMCSDTGEIYQYWERAGFSWIKRTARGAGLTWLGLWAPLWSIAAPRRAPAAKLDDRSTPPFPARERRRRDDLNLCRGCGYDLRAPRGAVRSAARSRRLSEQSLATFTKTHILFA